MPAMRKKVCLLIVEGPSDQSALEGPMSQLFENTLTKTLVMHGDITSKTAVQPANILRKLKKDVKNFLDLHFLKESDLQQIIHITDLDGAYIPDDNIIACASPGRPRYEEYAILTNHVENIKFRNQRKRQNLDFLIHCTSIDKIPYHIYYMSCNLDHVLYNCRNLSDIEKEKRADEFAAEYVDHQDKFLQFMNSSFAVQDGYLPSWNFVRTSLHSLERYSNLCLCFPSSSLGNGSGVLPTIPHPAK